MSINIAWRFPILTYNHIPHHQICIQITLKRLEIVFFYIVITIHKGYPFSLCIIKTKVSGGAYAPILLMEYSHTGIFLSILIAYFA